MAELENLTAGTLVRGVLSDGSKEVISVKWFGDSALELTYKVPATGQVGTRLLYRDDEPSLEVLERGLPWSFDGDGHLFRLVSEAQRIRMAHLFGPVLAVHTSIVEPFPHQITAVYDSMLTRQPLRFLLADDPGAGKTIMAGLLIRELVAKGDLELMASKAAVGRGAPFRAFPPVLNAAAVARHGRMPSRTQPACSQSSSSPLR